MTSTLNDLVIEHPTDEAPTTTINAFREISLHDLTLISRILNNVPATLDVMRLVGLVRHELDERRIPRRESLAGVLDNGEPCAYAKAQHSETWAEHDHDACLDVVEERSITWTEVTEPIDADGSAVVDIGTVQGVGDTYHLWARSTAKPDTSPPEWEHEFFVMIFPPSPVFGKHPKRSQAFPSNSAMLTAVGEDIDRDLKVENGG